MRTSLYGPSRPLPTCALESENEEAFQLGEGGSTLRVKIWS